jgi:hypothetical protein
MDCQDWTTVTVRRRTSKKDTSSLGQGSIQYRDPAKSEKIRIAKLEDADLPGPKNRVNSESLQALIRKRIEMKVTQEKADITCSFPRNTFKDIESNRLIPNEDQKQRILQNFSIQLKIVTIRA